MGLPPVDEQEVRRAVAAVVQGQQLPLGRIRITYTGGEAPLGSGRGDHPPTLVVVADLMRSREGATYVVTVPWPRNERGALAGLKTTSYGENVVALAYAAERVDGELRTPTLASGCLAGISRALLLEWHGAREVDEPIDALREASEIFLASTTRDVQAVRRLDDMELESPGPITLEAMRVWSIKERENIDP